MQTQNSAIHRSLVTNCHSGGRVKLCPLNGFDVTVELHGIVAGGRGVGRCLSSSVDGSALEACTGPFFSARPGPLLFQEDQARPGPFPVGPGPARCRRGKKRTVLKTTKKHRIKHTLVFFLFASHSLLSTDITIDEYMHFGCY